MDSTAIRFVPSQGTSILFIISLVGGAAFVFMFLYLIRVPDDGEATVRESDGKGDRHDSPRSDAREKARRP